VARTCNCKAAHWPARGKQPRPLHRVALALHAKICRPYRRSGHERIGLISALRFERSLFSSDSIANGLCENGVEGHQRPISIAAQTSNSSGSHSRWECERRAAAICLLLVSDIGLRTSKLFPAKPARISVPALRKEQSRFVLDLLHEICPWLRLRENCRLPGSPHMPTCGAGHLASFPPSASEPVVPSSQNKALKKVQPMLSALQVPRSHPIDSPEKAPQISNVILPTRSPFRSDGACARFLFDPMHHRFHFGTRCRGRSDQPIRV
jgi:hypothetical protein